MLEILSNIFDFSSNMSKFSSKISEKVQIHKKIKSNLPIQTYDFERVLNFKKLHITFFFIINMPRDYYRKKTQINAKKYQNIFNKKNS